LASLKKEEATTSDLTDVSDQDWQETRRRLAIIQQLAATPERTRSRAQVAAQELQLSVTQAYRLLQRYQADPRLTNLLPAPRGRKHGDRRLTSIVEEIIHTAIDEVYLTRQKPGLTALLGDIRRRCRALGIVSPSRKAVRLRLDALPAARVMARREGRKAARDRFAPVTGSLEAPWPLSLVQIDHTLVDVIVVDSVSRSPIQRPWLTLAIDVNTRCVPGFYLSLEPPSATSVALCMAQAALPKEGWLAARGVDQVWPVSGIASKLHLDNAREFRSEALRRGCEQYGIEIDYRPVRTPHYGGHIERLIGTMMGKVHLLPGTTFSDVRVKGDLDPEKYAAMTVEELERWLAHAIAGDYHRNVHGALNMPPLAAWERGIRGDANATGHGEPAAVTDPRRFLIDFLPLERRLVRRDGISLNSIHYWSDALQIWIGKPEKMILRYDPRDLSRIYLLAPDGHYYDVGYRDLSRPPISLWEHRLALKRLREAGRAFVDEAAIFRTIDAMRAISDDAVNASKSARRQRERRPQVIQGGRSDSTLAGSPPMPPTAAIRTDDPDTEPKEKLQPWQRMLPVEEWS
jgi:putative transposase